MELEQLEEKVIVLAEKIDPNLFLYYTLSGIKERAELMKNTIQAWKSGDAEKFHDLLFGSFLKEYPEFSEIYEEV